MSGIELRDKLLDLVPITERLSVLGKKFNVSRQYIHQIIRKYKVPYTPYKREAKKRFCISCNLPLVNRSYNRLYCDSCSETYKLSRKNGRYFFCATCGEKVYRSKTKQRKMFRGSKVFCSWEHYNIWRSSYYDTLAE